MALNVFTFVLRGGTSGCRSVAASVRCIAHVELSVVVDVMASNCFEQSGDELACSIVSLSRSIQLRAGRGCVDERAKFFRPGGFIGCLICKTESLYS